MMYIPQHAYQRRACSECRFQQRLPKALETPLCVHPKAVHSMNPQNIMFMRGQPGSPCRDGLLWKYFKPRIIARQRYIFHDDRYTFDILLDNVDGRRKILATYILAADVKAKVLHYVHDYGIALT